MSPTVPRSAVLSAVEEATIVEFRRRTLLSLNDVQRFTGKDVLGCLRDSIPSLTRPQQPQSARLGFCVGIQFRQAPQSAPLENSLRSRLPRLDYHA